MKTIVTLFSILVLLITFSSCKKPNEVIYVQLKSYDSTDDLSGISVSIKKERYREDGKLMSSSVKLIDEYQGISDENGLARVLVNDRGIRDYWFWIEAIPKLNSKGRRCFYSYPQKLDKGQAGETVTIRLQ